MPTISQMIRTKIPAERKLRKDALKNFFVPLISLTKGIFQKKNLI